jgi:hypothetical protein
MSHITIERDGNHSDRSHPARIMGRTAMAQVHMRRNAKFEDSCGIKVLLVSESAATLGYLSQQLKKRGYRCWFASSAHEFAAVSAEHHFPLVLSTIPLWREAILFDDATRAVFYCYPVHNDCWWLPVMRDGEQCLGDRGLRSREFGRLLDKFRQELETVSVPAHVEKQLQS